MILVKLTMEQQLYEESNWKGSMYVCLTVALCDCVLGKGEQQLGQGERSSKKCYFPTARANQARDKLSIGRHAANFALGN